MAKVDESVVNEMRAALEAQMRAFQENQAKLDATREALERLLFYVESTDQARRAALDRVLKDVDALSSRVAAFEDVLSDLRSAVALDHETSAARLRALMTRLEDVELNILDSVAKAKESPKAR